MSGEVNGIGPHDDNLTIRVRTAEIALMIAEIHVGDGDCIGVAARELCQALGARVDPSTEFDC